MRKLKLREAREIAARAPIPPGLKAKEVPHWRSLYARALYRGRTTLSGYRESASWFIDPDKVTLPI